MFFEWTVRLLAATFPSDRGDAVAVWSELVEKTPTDLVPSSEIVLINNCPDTPTVVYCSNINLAQLIVARFFIREMIPVVKRGLAISHPEVESALQEMAPTFLGVMILISSYNYQGITHITGPIMASLVTDEECLLDLKDLEHRLSRSISRLRSNTAIQQPVAVESAGARMELVPFPWRSLP